MCDGECKKVIQASRRMRRDGRCKNDQFTHPGDGILLRPWLVYAGHRIICATAAVEQSLHPEVTLLKKAC